MPDKAELNRIKLVLQDQGRSQSWLATKMGLNFNTVNGWSNNRHQPYLSDLVKVAQWLEVAPADLIVDGMIKRKRPDRSDLT